MFTLLVRFAASLLALGLLACSPILAGAQAATAVVPRFSHVFVVVLENHSLDQLLNNPSAPTFTSLAAGGAVLRNYYGVAHPSEPNYLALISGDTFGVADDGVNRLITAPTLVDQLDNAGISWKGYFESLPRAGSSVSAAGRFPADYAKKHNPFMLFSNITQVPERSSHVVPLTQLDLDLEAGEVPNLAFIVPNECSDMHSCGIPSGDTFLHDLTTRIGASSAWDPSAVLFVVFDEAGGDQGCCGQPGGGRTGALAVSPLISPGAISDTPYDHYSLLRTIQDSWGLPPLRHSGDPRTLPIVDIFWP